MAQYGSSKSGSQGAGQTGGGPDKQTLLDKPRNDFGKLSTDQQMVLAKFSSSKTSINELSALTKIVPPSKVKVAVSALIRNGTIDIDKEKGDLLRWRTIPVGDDAKSISLTARGEALAEPYQRAERITRSQKPGPQ